MSLFKEGTPENPLKNRREIAKFFDQPLGNMCFLRQVHSDKALFITEPYKAMNPPEADGLVTSTPGLVLSIQTADCVPIFLYDPKNGVIAAIHGGWGGLLEGVIENAMTIMRQKGSLPQDIIASIGPCISTESYEVGQDVFDLFSKKDASLTKFFLPGKAPQKYQLDLRGLATYKLSELGVHHPEIISEDTYTNEDLFFSCRRAAHKNEPFFGNQASCIMLR